MIRQAMKDRPSVHDLELAFRRCLGLSSDAGAMLATKGYTLPEAATALWVQLPYLKKVLRGAIRSPRLLRRAASLPTKNP